LSRSVVIVALALSLVTAPSRASAFDVPRRPASTSVSLLAGYGFQVDSVISSGVSAYRFGFGTRAGVTLPFGGYLGGTFITHSGTSVIGARDGRSAYVSIAHDSYLGPEAGFDFALWRLLVRPYVGSGLLVAFGKTAVGPSSVDDDGAFFYVAPGALAAYAHRDLFMGLDLRLPFVPALPSNKWAPTAMLAFGASFDWLGRSDGVLGPQRGGETLREVVNSFTNFKW
jgi:hypothetical protein